MMVGRRRRTNLLAPGGPVLPTFPAPSAIISQASPDWSIASAYLSKTTGIADPAGGTSAVRYTFTQASGEQSRWSLGGFLIAQPAVGSYTGPGTVTVSCIAKSQGATASHLRINLYGPALGSTDAGCLFNIINGTVGAYRAGGATESNAGITDLGNGWFQCWFSMPTTTTADIDSHQIGTCPANDSNFDATGLTVTVSEGFDLFRYQVVSGTNPNG